MLSMMSIEEQQGSALLSLSKTAPVSHNPLRSCSLKCSCEGSKELAKGKETQVVLHRLVLGTVPLLWCLLEGLGLGLELGLVPGL